MKRFVILSLVALFGCSAAPVENGRKLGWVRPSAETMALRTLQRHAKPARPFAAVYDNPFVGPLKDQGDVGRCVGFGDTGTLEDFIASIGLPRPSLSADYVYDLARIHDHIPLREDSGTEVGTGCAVITLYGAASESLWPDDEITWRKTPTKAVKADAAKLKGVQWKAIDLSDEATVKTELLANHEITFGFDVPESFMSDQMAATGIMIMPKAGFTPIGGHCVRLTGWDDNKVFQVEGGGTIRGGYKARNQWGQWGDGGDFWIPAAFLHSPSCADGHVVKSVPK